MLLQRETVFGREAFYHQQTEMYLCVMCQENVLCTANAGKSHITH